MQRTLAIVGPTASGKSTVALALAQHQQGEIVSCDSVQVYRGFDIGCAKPTRDEQQRVPHHLIDVVDWHEAMDAQRFRELASNAIRDIQERGRTPVLCGGTGLYLRALHWGLVAVPEADANLREQLYADEKAEPGVLYQRLRAADPDTAQRTEPNNLVHIVRALEILAQTGEPASVVRARHGFEREEEPLDVVVLDWDPQLLRKRIAERVGRMVDAGLVDEVAGLLKSGVSPDCRPMRAVGYRETCEVVRDLAPRMGLEDRIIKATNAYARRQRTWLRRERSVTWVQVSSESEALERVVALNGARLRAMD